MDRHTIPYMSWRRVMLDRTQDLDHIKCHADLSRDTRQRFVSTNLRFPDFRKVCESGNLRLAKLYFECGAVSRKFWRFKKDVEFSPHIVKWLVTVAPDPRDFARSYCAQNIDTISVEMFKFLWPIGDLHEGQLMAWTVFDTCVFNTTRDWAHRWCRRDIIRVIDELTGHAA